MAGPIGIALALLRNLPALAVGGTATAAAVDHFAFDGAGRKELKDDIIDSVKNTIVKAKDDLAETILGDSDSPITNLIKDNFGTVAAGAATLPFMFMGSSISRYIAIFAGLAIAAYAAYKYFTKSSFNTASEASNPDRVAELYASMGLNADGTAAFHNPMKWASQGGTDHVEEPKLWRSFEQSNPGKPLGSGYNMTMEPNKDEPEITNE